MPKLTDEQLELVRAGTHFVCAACGGFFLKKRDDQGALAESARIWGDLPKELLMVVCEPCYNKWMTSSPVHA